MPRLRNVCGVGGLSTARWTLRLFDQQSRDRWNVRKAAPVRFWEALDGACERCMRGYILCVDVKGADVVEMSTRHTNTGQDDTVKIEHLNRALLEDEGERIVMTAIRISQVPSQD
jgi:hypothetical protein